MEPLNQPNRSRPRDPLPRPLAELARTPPRTRLAAAPFGRAQFPTSRGSGKAEDQLAAGFGVQDTAVAASSRPQYSRVTRNRPPGATICATRYPLPERSS